LAVEAGGRAVRGLGFREHGGIDRVGWVEVPELAPGPGEVKIRVRAAGFNHLDLFVLEGLPGASIRLPHILGSDAAGLVESSGENASDLAVGTEVLVNPGLFDGTCEYCRSGREALCRGYRILGEHTQGSAAPFLVVPRRNVHRKPSTLSWTQAAAAPLVFQTAWRALRSVGQLVSGETVAIIGAGGGVATAALQIAKAAGARVAIVTRSPAKAERAVSQGADAGLVMDDAHPLDRLLWEWSEKRGVDLIFDSVGSPTVPRSIRALARGGRVVVIGATAGPTAEVDLRTLFWRQGSIRGSTMAGAREFEEVLGELSAGRLRPIIDSEWKWEDAPQAFARLTNPELFGKVVLHGPP
jgi:NADPH:quinone reductase-like Zn-dependent oxidoreductase